MFIAQELTKLKDLTFSIIKFVNVGLAIDSYISHIWMSLNEKMVFIKVVAADFNIFVTKISIIMPA